MLIATVKATGRRFVVRYDCRRARPGGFVRCWGPVLKTSRGLAVTFARGCERTYRDDEVDVAEEPRTIATLRTLELAPGTSWRGSY